MKLLGWTLAAGVLLTAAGESQAQLVIGNPYTGQGVMIGAGGVSVNSGFGNPYGYNAYGYNPYGYGMPGYGAYGLPSTRVYSSGYVAPGFNSGYGLGSYSATSYAYPYSYGVRSYSYGGPRFFRRGLFGRRYRW
jgi:hypothetical protein